MTIKLRLHLATLLLPLALVCGCAASGKPPVQAGPAVSKAEIAALFDRWDRSLGTGNADAVVANYATDAILVPTLSNQVRHTPAELRDYFVHFLQKQPRGRILESNIQLFGDIAVDSGIYEFETKNGRVPARYTFVYRKSGDRWLIVTHHSSQMPEKTRVVTAH
ncbi:SgcJ/EcaC family oxidoreductase [Plasticicumulans acidivorans]|uniref:Uncharacterized protein (TIGR02246 family) n=1 Tax=Plasticicumulans acidivorans TaxID=886464 RepID=A0A317MXL1_9GAMM|nr:SgcJ/EcaC family oxidoreductase [Plasticicumulans acidivorans]PWV64355.1 uncharacterized protein (TIGR02246 family) [Plasticicumulans acidivorans]